MTTSVHAFRRLATLTTEQRRNVELFYDRTIPDDFVVPTFTGNCEGLDAAQLTALIAMYRASHRRSVNALAYEREYYRKLKLRGFQQPEAVRLAAVPEQAALVRYYHRELVKSRIELNNITK